MRPRFLVSGLGGAAATIAAGAALVSFAPWVAAILALALAPSLAGSPGACLVGVGVAALAMGAMLARFDATTLLAAGCAITVLAWCLLRLTGRESSIDGERLESPPAAAKHLRRCAALGIVAAALCTVVRQALEDCLPLAGPDLPGLAACGAGLALAAAVGASLSRFLCSRHRVETPLLILLAGVAAAVCVIAVPHEFEPWLARAQELHAPDVSRTQFLAGSALLGALGAGPAALALGGLFGALAEPLRRNRGAAIAVGCGIAAGIAALPGVRDAPAASAVLAVALVVSPPSFALVVTVAALAIGAFEALRTRPLPRVASDVAALLAHADRIYVDVGHADAIAATGDPPAPGWPADDGIRSVLTWIDKIAPPGAIAVPADVAEFGPDLGGAGRRAWFGFDERRYARDAPPIASAWLRTTAPDVALGLTGDVRPRVIVGGVIVQPIDLWRASRADLDAWLAAAPAAEVVLFARFAATVERVGSSAPAAEFATRGPWRAFERADAAPRLTSGRIQTGPSLALAHMRLAPELPRTGAKALAALLERSTTLDANDASNFDARVRLELALATLVDDANEQDRLLRLLETRDPAAAASLRRDRRAARERLLLRLLREAVDDPTNADVHFRLGTVFARGSAALAGVEELTACIQFRPALLAGFEELAGAYLNAARTNQFKWTPTGDLDVNYGVQSLVHMIHLDKIAAADQARMWALLGAGRRVKAARAALPSESDDLRHDALGIFQRALELDPLDGDALRLMAATFLQLGEDAAALDLARDAVARRPLDPNARIVASIALRAVDGEQARNELARAFRAGFEFPVPRTR